MKRVFTFLFAIGTVIGWGACSGAGKSAQERLQMYERMQVQNPGIPSVLRELGIAHYELGKYEPAESYLKEAFMKSPADPKIALYYGLVLEATSRKASALDLYKRYADFDQKVLFTRLMEGRFFNLRRDILKEEFAQLAQKEVTGELTNGRLVQEAIAVFPFTYLGKNKQYAPLSRGISALIIGDLGNVKAVKMLERMQMSVLLEEIERGKSGAIDESSAPRAGRILGAGRIVSGNFNVPDGKRITIDAGYFDVAKSTSGFKPVPGPLSELFRVQKQVVLNLVDMMKIPITTEERRKIEDNIPTQNLQAFLAYCRGMEADDRGDNRASLREFQRAVDFDPNFRKAKELLEVAKSREAAGAGGKSIDVSYDFSKRGGEGGTGSSGDGGSLVQERLEAQGSELGQGLFPSTEKRKPAEEFGRVTEQTILPTPPRFPDKGN